MKKESLANRIYAYILEHPNATGDEVANDLNTTASYVFSVRKRFVEKGLLEKKDPNWKKIAKKRELLANKQQPASDNEIAENIKRLFKKTDVQSIESLSDFFDVGVGRIRTILQDLIEHGHTFKIKPDNTVVFSTTIEKSESRIMDIEKMSTGFYRFGVTGDNHLCSNYERLDVLNALYDIFQREGITTVFNTGNWIDGEARFNKNDIHKHGFDNQVRYWIDNFPLREGIITQYITGDDHEGWYTQQFGINVGRYAENLARKAGREDLKFLGHMEADILLPAPNGQTKLRVLHPGGGSSYAISYTAQKIVESYTEAEKPDVLFVGHYHKAEYSYIRGVHTVQTGTTMDQSPFMRKKRLAAHLGGWIVEFMVDDQGRITRFKQEFFPFYDNAYYTQWNYKW